MERHLEQQMLLIRGKLLSMAALVDNQVGDACAALFSGAAERLRGIHHVERQINEMESRIEEECQQAIALSQPVARDLRLLMSILRINGQLERAGDIAINVAERAESLAPHTAMVNSTRLSEMASIARLMLSTSVDAFHKEDSAVAQNVLAYDDVVDNLDRSIFREVVRMMNMDPTTAEPGSHIIVLSRHLERLGDHSTNIAEQVIFMVNARTMRHHQPSGISQ